MVKQHNNNFRTIRVMGFRVFSDDLKKISIDNETCRVINTISPNSYGLTIKKPDFGQTLRETDFLVLDGVYFALASILLRGKNIKKNQGPEVFRHFINRLDKMSGKVFFLGSTDDVLSGIRTRIEDEYPGIEVASYSPPFKDEFSTSDNKEIVNRINSFKPNIVFIGMTAPKQEKWAIAHYRMLNAGLVICIGNVFDWYAGTQKEIHPFFFTIRLGWLARIFLRPEIFKRNIGNQMIFFWHLLLILFKFKKHHDS